MTYANLGVVIGHEIIHGFDVNGKTHFPLFPFLNFDNLKVLSICRSVRKPISLFRFISSCLRKAAIIFYYHRSISHLDHVIRSFILV